LSFLLARLLGQLCERLAARALATNEIRLKMQLDPSEEEIFGVLEHTRGRRKAPKQKNSEHFGDAAREKDSVEQSAEHSSKRGDRNDGGETRPSVYEHTLRLPLPMRDPKALLRLWRLHLEANPPASPIVKIEMAAEPAKTRFAQSGLFTPLSPDPEKLEITMARTRHLVGDGNIGAPETVDTHRPFAFRVNHFDPADPNAPAKKQKSASVTTSDLAPHFAMDPAPRSPSMGLLPATALRVFRPAIPVKIEIGEEAPARVFFGGVWGSVIAASGPWRTSGDWWSSDPWNEDEWDLEIAFPVAVEKESKFSLHKMERAISRGVYRAIRERASGNWFIRGVYD
jgi:protein ImuB